MRLNKLGVLGLTSMVVAVVSALPGCSAEPQATRAIAGAGGTAPVGNSGSGGMTVAPTAGTGGSAGATVAPTAGTGGSGGDATAGTAGSGGSPGGGGGSGGGGGTAGSGGGGTAGQSYGGFTYGGSPPLPERTCETAAGPDDLLDDFEDSNISIHVADSRNGSWSTNNDASVGSAFTGTAPVAAEGRSNSVGWCSTATGHTAWGANIVLKPLSPVCGYDASIYTGVCFYAKGTVSAGGPIEFGIGTADTVPTADGGVCTPVTNCWYNYMANIDGLMENSYQEYCFTWAELTQWVGTPAPAQHEFDPAAIVQMEWKFTARGAEAPTNGELCIDDVRFMTE